jgi:hypothetical protein
LYVIYFNYADQKRWTKEESWQHSAIFRTLNYIQHLPQVTKLSAHERGEFQFIELSDNIAEIPEVRHFIHG